MFFKKKSEKPPQDLPLHDYKSAPGLPLDRTSGLPLPPRTPSPTPSDIEELKKGALDWRKIFKWSTWLKKKYIGWYIALVIFAAIITLISVYTTQIVEFLRPTAEFLRDLPAGWTIPIAIMFVLSFPPLFGQEIVMILCGLVWGLWIGFGIAAAGTFLGEVGNFYAFRYWCQARGDKLERTNMSYACLAKVIRDGGFWVALVARFSAIPGHFTTAIFSTCGMGIWEFSAGAFLSLPKQFAVVYLGVMIHEAADGQSTQEKVTSAVILIITTIVTIFAMWWVLKKMNEAKPEVLRDRRRRKALEAHQDKPKHSYTSSLEAGTFEDRGSTDVYRGSADNLLGRPSFANGQSFQSINDPSYTQLPPPISVQPQPWDANGRVILDYNVDNRSHFERKPSLKTGHVDSHSPSPPMRSNGGPDIMVTTPSHHSHQDPHGTYGFEDNYYRNPGHARLDNNVRHVSEPTDLSYMTAPERH